MTADFSDERISAYLDGELGPAERAELEALLATSAEHRQLMDELRALRQSLQDLPRLSLGSDFADRVLRRAAETAGASEVRSGEPVESTGMNPFDTTGGAARWNGPSPHAPSFELEARRWRRAFWSVASVAATLLIGLIASNAYWLAEGIAFQTVNPLAVATDSRVAPQSGAEFAPTMMMATEPPNDAELAASTGGVALGDEPDQFRKSLADAQPPDAGSGGGDEVRQLRFAMPRNDDRLSEESLGRGRDASRAAVEAKAAADAKADPSLVDPTNALGRAAAFKGGLGGGGGGTGSGAGLGGFGGVGGIGGFEKGKGGRRSSPDMPPPGRSETESLSVTPAPPNTTATPGSTRLSKSVAGAPKVADGTDGSQDKQNSSAENRGRGAMPGGPSPRLDSAGASRSGGGGPAPAPGIKGNPEQYYQLLEGERRTRGVPKPAELRSSNGTPDSPPIGAGRPPAPSAGRPQPPAGPGEGSPGPGGAANSPKAVPPPGPPPATDNVAAPVTDQPRGKPGAGQSSVVDHSQTEGAEPSTGRYRQRQFDAIISSQAAANPRFVWVTLNPNVSDEQVADTLGRNILAETPPGGDALPDNRGKAVDPKSGSKDQLNYKLPLSTATNGSGQVLRVRGSIAQMENFVSELRKASAQVDWIVPPQSDAKKLVAGKAEWTDRSVPEQAWLENRVENFENRKNLAPLARNPSVVDEYFVVLFRVPAVDNAVGAITNSTQAGSTPAAPTKPREKPVPAEPAAKPGAP